MAGYAWHPIEPLTDDERAVDLAAIRPLYDSWRAAKERLQGSGDEALKIFTQQLIRRMSVETGILERLYNLDRGTTEILVAAGFIEDLVSRSSTDVEPAYLIDVLRDQEAGIHLIMRCVTGERSLTKGLIHELHAVLTQHEETTLAMDQFGTRFEIPLIRGAYKTFPNNPQRSDGEMHEYCPPLQVESEMDKLLEWFSTYSDEDPVIVGAWLHHRFAQIHPYQDGNGRVARVLLAFVLLRAGLLPVAIDRDLRTEYLEALEAADSSNLGKLSSLFARLERAAILQALSVETQTQVVSAPHYTAAVIESLAEKLFRRRQAKQEELRRVNDLAVELRQLARTNVGGTLSDLKKQLSDLGEPEIYLLDGGPDRGNSHWYKYEVVESAKQAGTFANFAEAHFFLRSTIRVGRERLDFIVSLHHIGRELTGIMEATAFARLESFEDSDEREKSTKDFFVCSLDPFVFTHATSFAAIDDSFVRWLDPPLAVAIKEYGDRL